MPLKRCLMIRWLQLDQGEPGGSRRLDAPVATSSFGIAPSYAWRVFFTRESPDVPAQNKVTCVGGPHERERKQRKMTLVTTHEHTTPATRQPWAQNKNTKTKWPPRVAPANGRRERRGSPRARALWPMSVLQPPFGKAPIAAVLLQRRHFETPQNVHKENSFKTSQRWRRSASCCARGARGKFEQILPVEMHFAAPVAS